MSETRLVFRDTAGHEEIFMVDPARNDQVRFSTAWDAFVQDHVSEDNAGFLLERTDTDEALLVVTTFGMLRRIRNQSSESPVDSYLHYTSYDAGSTIILVFAFLGYDGVERFGPWASDPESVAPDDSFENLELARANEYRKEKERRQEIDAMPKLDQKLLEKFCKIWADTGYNEYVSDSEVYYVLFSHLTLEEVGPARDDLLATIDALGLHIVESSRSHESGEVWVRSDPRVDIEMAEWG